MFVNLALKQLKTNTMKKRQAEWSDNVFIPVTPRTQLQDQVHYWKQHGSFNLDLYLRFCKLKKAES